MTLGKIASKQLRDLRKKVAKTCPECGALFNRLKTAIYCSDRCKNRVNMRSSRKKLRRSRTNFSIGNLFVS